MGVIYSDINERYKYRIIDDPKAADSPKSQLSHD